MVPARVIVSGSAFVLVASAVAPGEALRGFSARFEVGVNVEALSAAAGDLDGDGDQDFVATDGGGSSGEVVLLRNPGGLQADWERVALPPLAGGPSLPISVEVADIDLDGDLDVVSVWRLPDVALWHENTGSGFVARHLADLPGTSPTALDIGVADADGDGDIDVGVTGQGGVFFFQNRLELGSVGWSPFTLETGATTARTKILFADVDADGDLDPVTNDVWNGELKWYRLESSPSGLNFLTRTLFSDSSARPAAFDAVDFDGDGDVDFVLGRDELNAGFDPVGVDVILLENPGVQPASFVAHPIVPSLSEDVRDLAAEDFDGDGDVDVSIVSGSSSGVLWFENPGSGGAWTDHVVSRATPNGRQLFAHDVDLDGAPDLAFALPSADSVRWIRNDLRDAERLSFVRRSLAPESFGASRLMVSDVDGDGDPDVLSMNTFSFDWHERRNGDWPPAFNERTIVTSSDLSDFDAGDVDADGLLELVVSDRQAESVRWFEFDSTVAGSKFAVVGSTGSFTDMNDVSFVDVNADGVPDIGAGDWSTAYVLAGDPGEADGFGDVATLASPAFGALEWVDVDGDGDVDIVGASRGAPPDFSGAPRSARFYESSGGATPSFTEQVLVTTGAPPGDVAILEEDGVTSVLITAADAEFVTTTLRYSPGVGGGGPALQEEIFFRGWSTISASVVKAVGDLDGDGDLDVVVGEGAGADNGDALRWLEQAGPGEWVQRVIDPALVWVEGLDVADLDEDGDLDIIVSTFGAVEGLFWYENALDPVRSPDITGNGVVNTSDLAFILGGWGPCDIEVDPCLADLNRDGVVNSLDLSILLGAWTP